MLEAIAWMFIGFVGISGLIILGCIIAAMIWERK